ncbi:anthranilate synthase component I family protein [Mycetocola reblochoni]|uniref:Para-aminobenzoate synthase, aminase component n=2 Tax=Mycetocola reblochoni TaxID=331618 RepID=A0A1R4JE93_9MICO|nr:anthranilate synthase component I family protein [Mycetocola reblochoni]RLP69905.1 anthranilate synthase component I family protein [Mycetocola reblochoni]SJN30357.1 Para-aminobenzoate synthase, aminase component [Mycetocola reblochoni REB411]
MTGPRRLTLPAGMSPGEAARRLAGGASWALLDGPGWGEPVIAIGDVVVDAGEALRRADAPTAAADDGGAALVQPGSLIGRLDYDLAPGGDDVPRPAPLADHAQSPSGAFFVAEHVLPIVAAEGTTVLLDTSTVDGDWLSAATSRLAGDGTALGRGVAGRTDSPAAAVLDGEAYIDAVRRVTAAITRGDVYVACLTTRYRRPPVDPVALHDRLLGSGDGVDRFSAVVSLPESALVSCSPELYLAVDDDGRRAVSEPIKGTAPRGPDAAGDVSAALALAADPKERAENTMIVDLVRNDLSRISTPGGVRVDRLCAVETHPRVHQMVSTVSAAVRPGVGVADIVRASFPAGSMTGAPKGAAMTLIAELEPDSRGSYAGAFGVLTPGSGARLAMTIRTAVVTAEATLLGTGAGVTVSSDPAAELAEMQLKAAPLLEAIDALVGGAAGRADTAVAAGRTVPHL